MLSYQNIKDVIKKMKDRSAINNEKPMMILSSTVIKLLFAEKDWEELHKIPDGINLVGCDFDDAVNNYYKKNSQKRAR